MKKILNVRQTKFAKTKKINKLIHSSIMDTWCGQLVMVKQTESWHQTYHLVFVKITLKNTPSQCQMIWPQYVTLPTGHSKEDISLKMKGKCRCGQLALIGTLWQTSQVKGARYFWLRRFFMWQSLKGHF